MEEALRKCETVNNSTNNALSRGRAPNFSLNKLNEVKQGKRTTEPSRKSNVSEKNKVQSERGVTAIGVHVNWHLVEHPNLQETTLDCFRIQESIQGMEHLSSGAPAVEGYFATPPSMQITPTDYHIQLSDCWDAGPQAPIVLDEGFDLQASCRPTTSALNPNTHEGPTLSTGSFLDFPPLAA
ncbi:hypothetical protein Ancab_021670 [Ancistrocladus abbreviatus]